MSCTKKKKKSHVCKMYYMVLTLFVSSEKEAPFWIRIAAASCSAQCAAAWSGVQPSRSRQFTSAPALSNSFITSLYLK